MKKEQQQTQKQLNSSNNKSNRGQKKQIDFGDQSFGAFLARKIVGIFQFYTKSKLISIAFFCIYSFQLLSQLFNTEFAHRFSSKEGYQIINYLSLFLHYFKLYPILFFQYSDHEQRTLVNILYATINLTLIIYALWSILAWVLKNHKHSLEQTYGIGNVLLYLNQFILNFSFVMSAILHTFPYLIWIPSIETSLQLLFNDTDSQQYNKLIATFTLLSSLVIQLNCRLFDKNYSFLRSQDFLAQRKNNYKFVTFAADFLIQVIQLNTYTEIQCTFHFILSLIRLFFLIKETPFFLENRASFFHIFVATIYTILSFSSLLIIQDSSNSNQITKLSVIILICIPCCFKISSLILLFQIKRNQFYENTPNTISSSSNYFIRYIYSLRYLTNMAIEDYMNKGKGILFENLYSNHLMKHIMEDSSDQERCFCSKYIKDFSQIQISELNGVAYRKNFLNEFMNNEFQNFLKFQTQKKKQNIEIYLAYISFLIEVVKAPTKAYSQLVELRSLQKMGGFHSAWNQCEIYQMVDSIKYEFSKFFQSSEFQNQRLNLQLVFEYDSICNDLKEEIKIGLIMKEQFFQFLYNDNIKLQNLSSFGEKCLVQKNKIQKMMLLLFDLHPYQKQTLLIGQVFIEFFEFRKKKLSTFCLRSKQILRQNLLKYDLKINLFIENTCALFISLRNQQLSIKKSSNQANSILNHPSFLNKSFLNLSPQWASDKFIKLIHALENEGNMTLIQIGEYFTFLQDYAMNIFPVTIRTALTVLEKEQFGLSLFITKIYNQHSYIVCNSQFNVISCSNNSPSIFKRSSQSKNNLKPHARRTQELDVKILIPYLSTITKDQIIDINSIQGYNEQFGFKNLDLHFPQSITSIMMISNKEYTKKQIINSDNPYGFEKYFDQLELTNFNFQIIQFFIFKLSDITETQSSSYVIEIIKIKQTKRTVEINEMLHKLQLSFNQRFPLSKIRIPLFDNEIVSLSSLPNLNTQTVATQLTCNTIQEGSSKFDDNSKKKIYQSAKVKEQYAEQLEILDKNIKGGENISESKPYHAIINSENQEPLSPTKQVEIYPIISPQNTSTSNLFYHQKQEQNYSNELDADHKFLLMIDKQTSQRNIDPSFQKNSQHYLTTIQTEKFLTTQTMRQDINGEGDIEIHKQIYDSLNQNPKCLSDSSKSVANGGALQRFGNEEFSEEISKDKKGQAVEDKSSVNSASSQFFSKKQSLYDMVITRKQSKEIIYGKGVGLVSLAIMMFVAFYLYFTLNQQFDSEKIYYKNLVFGNDIFEAFVQIERVTEIKMSASLGYGYQFLTNQFTPEDFINFDLEGKVKLKKVISYIGNLRQIMQEKQIKQYLLYNKMELYIYSIVDYQWSSITYTLIYELLNLPLYAKGYLESGAKEWRQFIYMNYQSYLRTFQELQRILISESILQLEESKKVILWSFFIYEIASICSVIIILPLYFIIQVKKEQILKLMVTFSPSFLEEMIQRHHFALSMEVLKSGNQINEQNILPKITQATQKTTFYSSIYSFHRSHNRNQKKRQVSTVNNLNRSSYLIFFIVFALFLVISLYTLLSYIFTKDYFDHFLLNVNELSLISSSKSFITLDYASVYLLMNCQVYQFTESQVKEVYRGSLEDFLPTLINTIQELYFMEKNFQSSSRGYIPNYEIVLKESLTGNACNLLNSTFSEAYPNLDIITSVATIPTTICQKTENGALAKGLIFWMETFKNKYASWIQLFNENYGQDLKIYFQNIGIWDYFNNLRATDQAYYYARDILDTLANFMSTSSCQYIESLQQTQLYLFVYNIIVTSAILLFIWNRYINWMSLSLYKTNALLSLIPIEYSIDNPYILSYLTKERNKMKGK